MDFLDPAKRQAHIRRLFLGYFLIGIAIALASTILVVISNGYDVDRKTGKVIQNGLIFANSSPVNAEIFLNGESNGKTDKRLTVPKGVYNVELQSKGYDTWKKKISLDGGSIERLFYPKLFPSNIKSSLAKTYLTAPNFSTQSPDRRWIMVAQPGSLTSFDVFDTANVDRLPVAININPALLTVPKDGGAQKISLVEWSTDNRHLIIKHDFGNEFEFILIDRDTPTESININTTYGLKPTKVNLRDKKYDQLFLYDATTKVLQTTDLKTKELKNLLTGVIEFKSYQENTVLYSTEDPTLPGKVVVKILDNDKTYTLRVFQSGAVLLNLARYDGAMYVATSSVAEGKSYIFKDPLIKLKRSEKSDVTPFTLIRLANPDKLTFSNNTQFVAVQSGSKFAVYDFENSRRFNFETKGSTPSPLETEWMDGHRILINQDSKAKVIEFDGSNTKELGAIQPGMTPYFDRDYKRMFSLLPLKADPAKTELLRSSLVDGQKP